MMMDIYANAESVAVWLGEEAEESHLAFQLINRISKAAGSDDLIEDMLSDKKWGPHFTATVNLFQRDFWKRLWVGTVVIHQYST